MKSKLCISFLSLSCVLLIVFFACRKANNGSQTNPAQNDDSGTAGTRFTDCTNPPNYGDSIIYPKYKGPNNDYTVSPKNDSLAGKFIAWPQGLVIDSTNGTINVTQSETGVRYNVGYIKNGTTDTCISTLVIAGATYVDSIYVLDNNDTLAAPYFNANPVTPPVCDNSDDTDYPGNGGQGNTRCYFDDGGAANGNNVKVRTISGIINLKKTVTEGAFGANPQNGDTKFINIFYRLNDGSARALQVIQVQLMYYEHLSDVPASLRSEISIKRQNFFDYRVVSGKPRPPLLIIVLHN